MVSATSAWLREARPAAPAKITSSMPPARMALAELAPITQRSASRRFDLPQPFGPTTPVTPGSIRNSVGSTKDLKPVRRSRWKCTGLVRSLRLAGRFGDRLLGRGARRQQDRRVHIRGGHRRGFDLLAVDEDCWRGIDAVLLGGPLGAGRDGVCGGLIGQAGVEVSLVHAVVGGDLLQDGFDLLAGPLRLAAEHLVDHGE